MSSSEPGLTSTRAFLGLGSNLGDRWMHLRKAVDQLRGGSGVPVTAVSPVYETEPVGGPEDQGPYLNLVVELALPARFDAYRLLTECHRLEASAGRVRSVRWGPRTLDVDVLWIDGLTLDDPDLTVPHPRMWERRFVVAPLADLAPDLAGPAEFEASGGEVANVGTL
ncbi:MAG TPA: 2-amino-4-hydroxy-6-hydroxymethyldihydropteridine diphosphokinase [Acidimicrobiales bacterium]